MRILFAVASDKFNGIHFLTSKSIKRGKRAGVKRKSKGKKTDVCICVLLCILFNRFYRFQLNHIVYSQLYSQSAYIPNHLLVYIADKFSNGAGRENDEELFINIQFRVLIYLYSIYISHFCCKDDRYPFLVLFVYSILF